MKKLSYERFLWFHNEVKEKKYPNATRLSERFEVCKKTAQRDIEFFKERLNAPLMYSLTRRGYYYTDDTFEIPAIWLKREEIVALLLARRLAASIPDRGIKNSLGDFFNKLSPFVSVDAWFDAEGMDEKISVKNIEYFNVDDRLFQEVVETLFKKSTAVITYYSPHRNRETTRRIVPLHLLNYMGNWHLISYCGLKKELRDFALSRIRWLRHAEESILLPDNLPPMKEYLRKQFGIFAGEEKYEVVLRFSSEVSRWVQEQIWHKRQETCRDAQGRLLLKVPVSDFREIKREILKFGADVEVLEPDELRNAVKKEIEKMKKIYE